MNRLKQLSIAGLILSVIAIVKTYIMLQDSNKYGINYISFVIFLGLSTLVFSLVYLIGGDRFYNRNLVLDKIVDKRLIKIDNYIFLFICGLLVFFITHSLLIYRKNTLLVMTSVFFFIFLIVILQYYKGLTSLFKEKLK